MARRTGRWGAVAAVGVVAALIAAACGPPPPTWAPETDPVPADVRPIDAVASRLASVAPEYEGDLWSVSEGNELQDDWLLDTPDCWGQDTCSDPQGFDRFTGAIADDIAGATQIVDLLTLNPLPTGGFRDAIVEGLRRGLDAGHSPVVRIFAGVYPFGTSVAQPFGEFTLESVRDYGMQLLADVGPDALSTIDLTVARVASQPLVSWNHSKVLAVDGRSAIVGGHNLWAGSYLQTEDPVHDISMRVVGPAAGDAQHFAARLWAHGCTPPSPGLSVKWASASATPCNEEVAHSVSPTPGGVRVMSLGEMGIEIDASVPLDGTIQPDNNAACGIVPDISNFGGAVYDAQNIAEEAMRSFIHSAQERVVISQQDLLGFCPIAIYDIRLVDAIVERLLAGVQVTMILSSPGASTRSGTPYSNIGALNDVVEVVIDRARRAAASDAEARAAVCGNFQLAELRFADSDAWPNGKKFANHAKVIAVDREAFSVGSNNLYPSWLQEYAFLVDDDAAAAEFYDDYLDPMWEWSRRTAVVDAGQGRCTIP